MMDKPSKRLVAAIEDGLGNPGADLAAEAARQRNIRALLSDLPDEEPGAGFAARVMARLPEPRASRKKRLVVWLWAPRLVAFRWNLALAFVVVVTLPLVVVAWRMLRPPGAPAASSVTLVLVAPGARSVALAGDFNRWQPANHPLHDDDGDGVWTTALTVPPGRYEYMFVVDGQWVTDPLARSHRPDGFGHRNAVLDL